MNQWKRELDRAAGNFKEEKSRLMHGVIEKQKKTKSKRMLLSGSVASLFIAVLGILIYQYIATDEQTASDGKYYTLQYATLKQPFYLDETSFQFYQAIHYDLFFNDLVSPNNSAVKQQLLDSAFQLTVTQQAIEYEAYNLGFRIDEQIFEERLALIRNEIVAIPKEDMERYAANLNMDYTRFVEQVYLPTYTKISLFSEFMNDKIDNYSFKKFNAFEVHYEAEINAIAKQLNVQFTPSEEISAMYEGVIGAIKGNDLLVVSDILSEEIGQLSIEAIEALYPEQYWFTHENPVGIEVGSKVRVIYDLRTLEENRANIISIEFLPE